MTIAIIITIALFLLTAFMITISVGFVGHAAPIIKIYSTTRRRGVRYKLQPGEFNPERKPISFEEAIEREMINLVTVTMAMIVLWLLTGIVLVKGIAYVAPFY